MDKKRISVLIVTYKQADVIGRNLDSILQQKDDGLYEIVVCDDCSPDNNWDVIQSYVHKYPNIIRAYRNNTNLGIYGNSDKCSSLHGDADLFCWLEGDDALEPGFFQGVQQFIKQNDINTDESIGLFCDYSSINPKGEKRITPNDNIKYSKQPLSLFIRGLVSWRAALFSKKVIEKFTPTVLDKGLALAELLFDSQWFRYVEKCYYCPIPGSIYYTNIGVSTSLGYQSSFKQDQALTKWSYFLEKSLVSDSQDKYWLKFKLEQTRMLIDPSLKHLFSGIHYYLKAMRGFPSNSYVHFKSNLLPMVKYLFLH